MSKDERRNQFKEEYEKICLKYGIYIWGCGCCGSPDLEYREDDENLVDNDRFLSVVREYVQ